VDDDGAVVVDEQILVPEGSASASASASAAPAAAASASAAASAPAATVLPETGGASLLALGAGALLVAGGLVARRIVR
jgi:LPXTG-motif cell wall-anchored protein